MSGDKQAYSLIQAWLKIYLWQDGIGAVPFKSSEYKEGQIDYSDLTQAKLFLILILQQVAEADLEWIDLE